jgi:outer membrane protein TolC
MNSSRKTFVLHRLVKRRPLALALAALALAGCANVNPVPFTEQDVHARAAADRRDMYADQEPITAPLTFHEASARALKYNLDYRLKLMENALAQGLHEVSRWDMMPRLLVGAGYQSRDNDSGGRSIGILTGVETLSPSTSQERNRTLANVEFSWNLLDFGVSYYRAQQKADQFLMAEERRRKVAQNVLQDVRNAYWRALGAQRLIARVDQLLGRVNSALERSRQAEKQGLLPVPTALAYQRALLDAVTLLSLRRQDLELAQAELSALLSIPPGTAFTLADQGEVALPPIPGNMAELENLALEHRPEIKEEWYRKRVTTNDIKAAMLQTLPGVQLDFANAQYDSNRYLHNKSWVDSGIRLSWNLFRLASRPALKRAHEAQEKTDDFRRMALSMAVLTQVRIGVQRYALARMDLEMAEESARVDERLLKYAQAAASTRVDSELEVIRAEARQLLTEYQRYASYANAQAAWGRLYNSIGLDVMPDAIGSHDVAALARAIEAAVKERERTTFKPAPAKAAGNPLHVTVVTPPAGTDAESISSAVGRALARHELARSTDRTPYRLAVKIAERAPERAAGAKSEPATGLRNVRCDLILYRPDGTWERFAYESVAAELTARSAMALVEAAVDTHAAAMAAQLAALPERPAQP